MAFHFRLIPEKLDFEKLPETIKTIFGQFCIKLDRSEFSLKIKYRQSLLLIKSYNRAKNQKKPMMHFCKKTEQTDEYS